MIFRAEFPDGVYQCSQVVRINIWCDAMPKIENVTLSLAETGQSLTNLSPDH